jgi:hypothetical protein
MNMLKNPASIPPKNRKELFFDCIFIFQRISQFNWFIHPAVRIFPGILSTGFICHHHGLHQRNILRHFFTQAESPEEYHPETVESDRC